MAVWLQFRPITFPIKHKLSSRNQVLRPTFEFPCKPAAEPFPRADAAPTQSQGRPGKHRVASAHGRSTPGSKNGRFWGGEAILRPFLHWQCQLGTVPYTVPYSTVYTVKYGHQNTLIRRIIRKYGPYRPNRTVPSDRTSTGLRQTQLLSAPPRTLLH